MRSSRVLLAVSLALVSLGQGCQTQDGMTRAPDYTKADHEGTPPPEQPPLDTWGVKKEADPQNDHPCGENPFTFGVVQDGVACNAAFDFTPLYRQAITQRNAILFATPCPGRCNHRYVIDNGVIKSCDSETRARLRLETALHCLANPREFESFDIPDPLPPGPGRITEAPWTPRLLYEEPFDQPPTPIACDEQVRLVYREKVSSCDDVTRYRPFISRAKQEAIRRQILLPCADGCEKRLPTVFDYTRWDCAANEVVVEVVFKPCRKK